MDVIRTIKVSDTTIEATKESAYRMLDALIYYQDRYQILCTCTKKTPAHTVLERLYNETKGELVEIIEETIATLDCIEANLASLKVLQLNAVEYAVLTSSLANIDSIRDELLRKLSLVCEFHLNS